MFITLEGPEGSGKSTQHRLLCDALEARGLGVVRTREPGGTPIGEQVRAVLHDLSNAGMLAETEILLYAASRAQHVGEVIRPALARGDVVVSDRYAESTMAYQGYGRGLDLEALRQITAFATGGLWPDLVIYLDLDVRVGLERKRRDWVAGHGEWNRMDEQTLAFHQRARQGYLSMASEEPQRWLMIDASRTVEEIHAMICDRVDALLAACAKR